MRILAVFFLAALLPSGASAAGLRIDVRDARGLPVANAVAWAIPERAAQTVPVPAIMDQKNRMFIPHVLVVQTGASVAFPNSDDVQHQVYSFSPAKPFQLPLYKGNPPSPIVFEKSGIVSLGCNIHDRMSAWIVVVDTPWFATVGRGRVELDDLPAGSYTVHVWHPGLRGRIEPQTVRLAGREVKDLAFSSSR